MPSCYRYICKKCSDISIRYRNSTRCKICGGVIERLEPTMSPLERAAYLRGLQRAVEVAKKHSKDSPSEHLDFIIACDSIAALEAEIAKGGPDAG